MSNIFDLFHKIESTSAQAASVSCLVVGLGNPGEKYEGTRHNAGFAVIDALAKKEGVAVNRAKFHALVGECTLGGRRTLLMKPQTFMNLSGVAVAEAAAFYKLTPDKIMVLCDDINFAPGKMRIRKKGSAGGHNGLKSIIEHLGDDGFVRFRLGVGQKPSPDYDLADFVLGKFGREDKAAFDTVIDQAIAALTLWNEGKIDAALSSYSK